MSAPINLMKLTSILRSFEAAARVAASLFYVEGVHPSRKGFGPESKLKTPGCKHVEGPALSCTLTHHVWARTNMSPLEIPSDFLEFGSNGLHSRLRHLCTSRSHAEPKQFTDTGPSFHQCCSRRLRMCCWVTDCSDAVPDHR